MVKAVIKFPDGTEMEIEGSVDEVVKAKDLMEKKQNKYNPIGELKKSGPISLILELKEEKFFDSPKTISEIKQKLEEKTHHYPSTSLSPALIRLVRRKQIGRIKKDGKWLWVKR